MKNKEGNYMSDKNYEDMTKKEKEKYDQEERDFKALLPVPIKTTITTTTVVQNEEKEDEKKQLISSNWYGHPADLPMRLVCIQWGKFMGIQHYALCWYGKKSGLFWGSYDIKREEIAECIVNKIKLQDSKLDKYHDIYFSDPQMMEEIKDKLISLSDNKLKPFLALF